MSLLQSIRWLLRTAVVAASSLLVVACAHQPPMYNWQAYQSQVYSYLKGEDYAGQISALEKNMESARSRGETLPPGFHAHLGMLYLKTGLDARGVEHIQNEKLVFPESVAFMDFMLRMASGATEPLSSPGSEALPAAKVDASEIEEALQ